VVELDARAAGVDRTLITEMISGVVGHGSD
jgi:hypothetical protein